MLRSVCPLNRPHWLMAAHWPSCAQECGKGLDSKGLRGLQPLSCRFRTSLSTVTGDKSPKIAMRFWMRSTGPTKAWIYSTHTGPRQIVDVLAADQVGQAPVMRSPRPGQRCSFPPPAPPTTPPTRPPASTRLHQEDFWQAMAVPTGVFDQSGRGAVSVALDAPGLGRFTVTIAGDGMRLWRPPAPMMTVNAGQKSAAHAGTVTSPVGHGALGTLAA